MPVPKTPVPKTPDADHSKPSAHMRRSLARVAVVQALFQVEFNPDARASVVDEILTHRRHENLDGLCLAQLDQDFFRDLCQGMMSGQIPTSEPVVSVLDQDWALSRLDPLLRLMMRLGAYELQVSADVPARVVVAEYVDLASAFLGPKETAMINAVLDRLAHRYRADEFGMTP